MKKTKKAKVKERIEVVCDLVDCFIDEEMTQNEFVEQLMEAVGKPLIKISEMEYVISEWEDNLYLESRSTDIHGQKSDWVQVEDLTGLQVWEYNELVSELNKHYPDYAIKHLEGRFV